MISFDDPAYGEIALHPAPLCILSVPLTLCSFFLPRKFMIPLNKGTQYLMFWTDNVIYILIFVAYEFVLIPLVYIKNFMSVAKSSIGFKSKLTNGVTWIFSGLFFSFYIACRDVYFFIQILTMH